MSSSSIPASAPSSSSTKQRRQSDYNPESDPDATDSDSDKEEKEKAKSKMQAKSNKAAKSQPVQQKKAKKKPMSERDRLLKGDMTYDDGITHDDEGNKLQRSSAVRSRIQSKAHLRIMEKLSNGWTFKQLQEQLRIRTDICQQQSKESENSDIHNAPRSNKDDIAVIDAEKEALYQITRQKEYTKNILDDALKAAKKKQQEEDEEEEAELQHQERAESAQLQKDREKEQEMDDMSEEEDGDICKDEENEAAKRVDHIISKPKPQTAKKSAGGQNKPLARRSSALVAAAAMAAAPPAAEFSSHPGVDLEMMAPDEDFEMESAPMSSSSSLAASSRSRAYVSSSSSSLSYPSPFSSSLSSFAPFASSSHPSSTNPKPSDLSLAKSALSSSSSSSSFPSIELQAHPVRRFDQREDSGDAEVEAIIDEFTEDHPLMETKKGDMVLLDYKNGKPSAEQCNALYEAIKQVQMPWYLTRSTLISAVTSFPRKAEDLCPRKCLISDQHGRRRRFPIDHDGQQMIETQSLLRHIVEFCPESMICHEVNGVIHEIKHKDLSLNVSNATDTKAGRDLQRRTEEQVQSAAQHSASAMSDVVVPPSYTPAVALTISCRPFVAHPEPRQTKIANESARDAEKIANVAASVRALIAAEQARLRAEAIEANNVRTAQNNEIAHAAAKEATKVTAATKEAAKVAEKARRETDAMRAMSARVDNIKDIQRRLDQRKIDDAQSK